MAALLEDMIQPNLAQSTESAPIFLFSQGSHYDNIADGCNSVIATKTTAVCANFPETELDFHFDHGTEKFFVSK
jgi:formate--tetrahydrofolate ligase